jgi:drug/metabolite transporter (DMT)-like permease
MVAGLALALSASVLWGTGDFAGGRLSRQLPLLVVVTCSQGAGLVVLLLILLARGHFAPAALMWGMAAGLLSLGSVTCFYRALAVGTMSVVAPVVATSAAVPVFVGLAGGERPGAVTTVGIALALCGVVLSSRQVAHEPPTDHGLSVVLAVAAAAFSGLQLVALQRAGAIDALTGVSASRATSVTVFVVALVLKALAGAAGPGRVAVLVLGYCGLRWSELAALRVRNFDLLRRRVLIEEAVTEVDGKTLAWGTPKTHARRSVPLPRFLADELARTVVTRPPGALAFPSPQGAVLRNRNARSAWFDAAAVAIGEPGLTPHELRHTAASLAIKAGANVKAVQRMLGHASAAMTLDVYSGLFDDDLGDKPLTCAYTGGAGGARTHDPGIMSPML